MFVTTDDPSVTRQVLHGLGHEYIEGEPVLVEVEDRPGGLADVTERLANAGVNVTGVLCVGRRPGFVQMTFCVDDEARAREVLELDASTLVGVSG
jgi:hypothetical protein